MDTDEDILRGVTEQIIGGAFHVGNTLGCGFLEKVYENALVHELKKQGLAVEQQREMAIRYDGIEVGRYIADIVVANAVIVEVKAVEQIAKIHIAQCLNYLKTTGLPLCLLLNFGGTKVEVKRLRI